MTVRGKSPYKLRFLFLFFILFLDARSVQCRSKRRGLRRIVGHREATDIHRVREEDGACVSLELERARACIGFGERERGTGQLDAFAACARLRRERPVRSWLLACPLSCQRATPLEIPGRSFVLAVCETVGRGYYFFPPLRAVCSLSRRCTSGCTSRARGRGLF